MKTILLFAIGLMLCISCFSQNTGVGTTTPQATLDIKGNLRVGGVTTNHFTYDSTTGKFTWFRNNGTITAMILDQFGRVGIGVPVPQTQLDVNGGISSGSLSTASLTITSGGSQYDFLMKNNSSGDIAHRKGHGALAVNFIICLEGIFPSSGGVRPQYNDAIVGEMRMFAGNFPPVGWAFCQGQLLLIATPQNAALFALIGTTYGGDGVTNFAVPDLRGAAPVSPGTGPAGYTWFQAERSN
jgi:hypothetical protein